MTANEKTPDRSGETPGHTVARTNRRVLVRRGMTLGTGLVGAGAVARFGLAAQESITWSAAGSHVATPGVASEGASSSGSLVFDPNNFMEETKTVSTDDGDKEVTYRPYQAIPYVANPVDANYQSLNVSVPVQINGTTVDATNAPILLDIPVGGYMSAPVTGGMGSGGGSPGGDMPSGGTPGAMPDGGAPSGGTPASGGTPGVPAGSAAMVAGGQMVSNGDLALAAGYVVVSPGVRGRDNVTADGRYYGKAPAAIVDLKAAVRYLRANAGRIPGNTDWIVSSGTSAGGALSALLGASADSSLYDAYLAELGAADASDAIFASADYCPITDLEHADMAYEWMYGEVPLQSGNVVDQTVSQELSAAFVDYQASLNLMGQGDFGAITASTYSDYLLKVYLEPAATTYLNALSDADRTSYLEQNPWITWSGNAATFTFDDFLDHVGRMKGVPAFDAFDLSTAENGLFGNETTDARHFTLYSVRHATGDESAELDSDLPAKITLMNPMAFIPQQNPARAKHWWIRVGTSDTNTSLTIVGNLAAALENLGDDVSTLMYWDAGHGANEDAPEFIRWIGEITGYTT